ncbi:DUF2380 domain-containing protein [Thiolinea disciformis]|uniref:DUF2380 domain-containing protein n=1 Tax=Thiolinea disciformis TaxID=125614 RepID=UPI0003A00E95|nr:DUF2380 domain-containing protein [Thiolinea disciformis]
MMRWKFPSVMLMLLWLSFAQSVSAQVVVLAFELQDTTLKPATAEELQRTASAQNLLIQALQDKHYPAMSIEPAQQQAADKGFGYLYDHPEAAAQLALSQGADAIVVGRVHKPSFLFAYFIARLVDAKSGKVILDTAIEAKGPSDQASTQRALVSLANKLLPALLAVTTDSMAQTSERRLSTRIYQKATNKAFADVVDDALTAISQHNFRILGQSDVGKAIAEREASDFPATTIIQFCNLTYAKTFLEASKGEGAIQMPCRLIIRQAGRQVLLETVLVESLSQIEFSTEVNKILRAIVDSAAS